MPWWGALVLALAVGLGTACTSPDTDETAPRVTDALGRTVPLSRPVERVVSLAPNLTEIVYAAGAGSTLVGVTTAANYPPSVDTLPAISALPVDFEAVAAQNPDLVLATDQINAPRDAETFDALDVPIYFFSFATLADVLDAIRTTGDLLGTSAAAADSAAALQREIDALQRRTASVQDPPRVLVLIGDDTLYAFGQGSYIHELVALAGGQSITDTLATQAPTLSDEYVLTAKPDVIVGAWGEDYDPSRLLVLHPTWDVVPAVQNGRVYSLPQDLLLRPGPRLVDGARRMARALHPSLFESATP
jgi:ABC-type Fe3+-hydroxamate transport system substrate-binding protein